MCFILIQLALVSSAWAFDPAQEDKQRHINASASIATASYSSMRVSGQSKTKSVIVSALVTLAVGHLKETGDRFYDPQDMQANAAGASAGLLLPVSFEWAFN